MILLYQGDEYGCIDTLNIKMGPLFHILKTEQDVIRSIVPALATREAMTPLANDPIMSSRSIRSFRHLKHKNRSTDVDFIHSSRIISLVQILATKKALVLPANDPIMS